MDRVIQQAAQTPLVEQALQTQRQTMIALGSLAQAVLGIGTAVDGLSCVPAAAGVGVNIGPGSIFSQSVVDQNAFGVLAADVAHTTMKAGINLDPVPFVLAPPAVAGQSVVILIEGCLLEADGAPVVLPFYNPANPAQPFSGPGGGGAAVNTLRTCRVQLQAKVGVPAVTGTQVAPATDAGWVPLYLVTLAAGAVSVLAGNIAVAPGAPFLTVKLPLLATTSLKTKGWIDAYADHGADPSGATDTTAALSAAFTDMVNSGRPLFIPEGHYVCNSAIVVDVAGCAKNGFKVIGAGGQNTVLDFTGVPAAQGVPLSFICSTGASFYCKTFDVAVKGDSAGPVVQVGKNDFSDAFNNFTANGLVVNNLSTNAAAVGVKLNYVITSNILDCSINCAGSGDAVQCCQVQATKIDGALGTATNAIHFLGGYNFGVTATIDAENIQRVAVADNAQSTGISFAEGQWVPLAGDGAIDAPYAANWTVFSSVNKGNGGPWITTRTVGVLVQNTSIGVLVSGGLSVAPLTGDADATFSAPAGQSAFINLDEAESERWKLGKNNTSEAGSNAGSDFIIARYDDTGAVIDNPVSISRATGRTTLTVLEATEYGFGGATPAAPPTVTGSRADPTAALASLLTGLAANGVIVNDTTA